MEKLIEKAKQIIKEADAILIIAGVGIRFDSLYPDFKGKEYSVYKFRKKVDTYRKR